MANLKKWLVMMGVLGMLVAVVLVTATSVKAQPSAQSSTTPKYSGVDMLFVIDQSGSTCGLPCGAPAYLGNGSDPSNLRFFGPQYSLNWLHRFQDIVKDYDPVEVNMGLFGFGDEQRSLLQWTNLGTLSDADVLRLNDDISPTRFGNVNLGNTDIYGALRYAKQMFDTAPAPAEAGTKHIKAIVLLTDGEPCVGDECNDTTKGQHLLRVENLVRDELPGYELYVVVLDSTNRFYSRWEVQWKAIVCANQANQPAGCNSIERYVQATDGADISKEFNRILTDLVQQVATGIRRQVVELNNGIGYFDVPPYQQFVRINIFKIDSTPISGVRILQPDGVVYPNPGEQGTNTPIQTYEISSTNIQPGRWTLDVSQAPANVIDTVETISDFISAGARVEIAPVDAAQADLLMFTKATFTVKIVDKGGLPLDLYGDPADPSYPLYPLDVKLKLYKKLGVDTPQGPPEQIISLPLASQVYNQFMATEFLRFSGEYEVRLDASYIDDLGQMQYVMEDLPIQNIDVQGTARSTLSIAESYADVHGLNPNSQRAGLPVELRADLRAKGTDQPLQAAADMAFQVTTTNQDGFPVIDQQVLPNSPAAGVGEVIAALALSEPGQYTVEVNLGWERPDGTFDILSTDVMSLEIRPITELRVIIVRPEDGSSKNVMPFEFLGKTPMTIQVEIRDENGQEVSLQGITNGAEQHPTVILKHNGKREDISDQMIESRPGIYQATLEHKGRGSYKVEASVLTQDLQLAGDHRWNPSSATAEHSRGWSTVTKIIMLAVGVGIIVLAVLIVLWLWLRWRLRQNPLQGALVLKVRDTAGYESLVDSIKLDDFGVNTKTFKGKGEFERIVVTTKRDAHVSEEKSFYVKKLRIRGQNIRVSGNTLFIPGFEQTVYQETGMDIMVDYIVGNNTDTGMF
ncbi:MAG: VWA domain-containing protein [Anaerolineae bacterium]|nr:VWA domain-containing protein [Anaerolineae bacterium]